MNRRLRLPSPATVLAATALFVALTGTAVAASPLVKRALFADNAGKLQGKTSTALVSQAVSEASKAPGPASTAAGLVSIKSAPWSAGPDQEGDFAVTCDPGQKAIAGGWDDPSGWGHQWDSRPSPDGGSWRVYVTVSPAAPGNQSGTVYAVCLK